MSHAGGRRRRTAYAVCALALAAGCGSAPAEPPTSPPAFPPTDAGERVTVTVVCDWVPFHPDLPTCSQWGLALLVRRGRHAVLVEAGADGNLLLHNLQALGADLAGIQAVVLTHLESGNWEGLPAILRERPGMTVVVPEEVTDRMCERLPLGRPPRNVIIARSPTEVVPGIITSGRFRAENGRFGQSLIIHTCLGPALIPGCGNPETVAMARRATRMTGERLCMILGGMAPVSGERQFERAREVAALKSLQPTSYLVLNTTCWNACLRAGAGAMVRFEPGAERPILANAELAPDAPTSRPATSRP